jgi:CBS domain-containing protein
MEDEDLAALLDKDLDMMSDTEEDLLDFAISARRADHHDTEESYLDELQIVLDSANSLAHLAVSAPDAVVSESQDGGEVTGEGDGDKLILTEAGTPFSAPLVNIHTNDEEMRAPPLTAEDLAIVEDLLKLMVESVERCAPILAANRNLPPMELCPLTIESSNLTIINEDGDVKIDTTVGHTEDASVNGDVINDLLDNRILAESRMVKEAQVSAAQESDRIMWDESNKYKQEIEAEKLRQEERKRKRAEARLQAIREKAAVRYAR